MLKDVEDDLQRRVKVFLLAISEVKVYKAISSIMKYGQIVQKYNTNILTV